MARCHTGRQGKDYVMIGNIVAGEKICFKFAGFIVKRSPLQFVYNSV